MTDQEVTAPVEKDHKEDENHDYYVDFGSWSVEAKDDDEAYYLALRMLRDGKDVEIVSTGRNCNC